ncbi:MAG TPA: M28 family peptidase [Lacibacter sp.]|nr:M28 family peptidase [Lacibacter sp.]
MKKSVLVVCCLLTLSTYAQKKNKTAEKFAQTILANDLKQHLFIVASPEMEGRETGAPGGYKAAAYVKQQFAKVGLVPGNKDSYEQLYPLYKDTLKDAQITINGTSFVFGKDFTATLNSINTGTMYISEVVYLGKNDTLTDIRGKAVVITKMPTQQEILKLYQRQPAVVFFIQSGIDKQPSPRSGRVYYSLYRSRQSATAVRISEDMGKHILQADFEKAKDQSLETKTFATELMITFSKDIQTIYASNVLGLIEGTDKKDEWIVISAHYDHIGITNGKVNPGADDDGSGTVGLIELAEAFMKAKAAGKGPRRNILFLAVSGEEKGLWGSDYYANHPVYPLDKTSIDINIDMIGRKDDKLNSVDSNNHVYLIGDDKLSSELPRYVDSINNLYINIITDRKYNDPKDPNRLYYRSDHYNFARKGVPIIFFFDGIHKDYHRPTDTPDKINYDLYEKRTKLVFFLAWEAANRNTQFVRDKPLEAVGTR